MHQFLGMWLNPNSRGSRLRIWQPWGCNSLHAHHFTATGLSGNSRPRRLKIAEPSGCKSRVADQPSLFELRLGGPACGSPGTADRFGSNPDSLGSASIPAPTNANWIIGVMEYWINGKHSSACSAHRSITPLLHQSTNPFPFARVVQQQRHDVESVASAG